MRRALSGLLLTALVVSVASGTALAKEEDFLGGTVVFARDQSLWRTDPKGKGPAVELVSLPGAGSDVRMIRTDPSGAVVLFDLGGTWWWARLDAAATSPSSPAQLACGAGPARLTADGRCVLCADPDGNVLLISLITGKSATRPVPAAGARVIAGEAGRDLLWAGADGVWRAPLKKLSDKRALAPEAPLRGFLAAPDGSRAVAVYPGEVYEKKQKVPAEVVDSFALDGKAARRMLYRDATVIDWSWDSTWLLVQEGTSACLTRAVGGEYKCWKGYTAVSMSPDGRWALVLGPRGAKADRSDHRSDDKGAKAEGEGSASSDDDDNDADDGAAPTDRGGLPDAPFSLYRAKLEGPYASKPSLVETAVDGAAVWLPGTP